MPFSSDKSFGFHIIGANGLPLAEYELDKGDRVFIHGNEKEIYDFYFINQRDHGMDFGMTVDGQSLNSR